MESKQSNLKKLVQEFIANNRAAALATVSKAGIPHVAIVYCIMQADLALYFMTRVEGRKFINLTYNPTVAMAITNEKYMTTLQLSGLAERVDDLLLEQDIWRELMHFRLPMSNKSLVPTIQMFERDATNELAIIKVTPIDMTYASFEQTITGHYQSFFQKII